MKKVLIEALAGNVEDCIRAYEGGADRIELNNGVFLGGLTPSYATVKLAKEKQPLPLMSMVRPRGAGFHYNSLEVETMFMDAEMLIEAGTDGIVFGFLKADSTVDEDLTRKMVELCHASGKEAVFHRAFDVTPDMDAAIKVLIDCGVDRILTSGLKEKAIQATDTLKYLNDTYGDQIELVLGSGVNEDNVHQLIDETGVYQMHASFKAWYTDPSTTSEFVSYSYSDQGDYEGVGLETLESFKKKVEA